MKKASTDNINSTTRKKDDDKLQSLSVHKSQHHHQMPCLNLHRKLGKPESLEDLFNTFRALKPAQSYPLPLVAANNISNNVLNGIEICNKLVIEKGLFLKSRNVIQINSKRAYKKNRSCKTMIDDVEEILKSTYNERTEEVLLPKELYNLALFIEKDPDPHFTGNENWYYSNCVVAKNILNTPCVISARGLYNNELGIIPLTLCQHHKKWRADESRMLQCCLNDLQPVLQVAATRKGFIAARKKSSISIVKLKGLAEHTPRTIPVMSLQSSGAPFTSVDIHKHEIVVTTTARELCVYNVRSDVPRIQATVPAHPDCTYSNTWNSVAYCRENSAVVLFADACGVSALDISGRTPELLEFWCTRPFLEGCERVSALRQSEAQSHLWYLATTHHLFGLHTSRRGAAAFVFRVLHHMSGAPLHCAVKCVDSEETVVLGDQACNQGRSFRVHFSATGQASVSAYASYVNSALDTLQQARTRGELLRTCLTKRFDNNLLGLSFLPAAAPEKSPDPTVHHAHRRLTLFSLRSSGDLFYQDMSQELLDERSDSPNELLTESERIASELTIDNEPLNDRKIKTLSTPVKQSMKDHKKGINSPVASDRCLRSMNGSTADLSNASRQDLNGSIDLFASQEEMELDGEANPPLPTSRAISPDLNFPSQHEHLPLYDEDTRSSFENFRGSPNESNRTSRHEDSRPSHETTRYLNATELGVLERWAGQFELSNAAGESPMRGARTGPFLDIFSDNAPPFHFPDSTQTDISSLLSDLQLSGIDTNIIECKDPIFQSITTWSDDSSDEDRITNRFPESIHRNDPSKSNRSDAESSVESLEEDVDADLLADLYVVSDSDATTASRIASFIQDSSDPDDPQAPPLIKTKVLRTPRQRNTRRPCTRSSTSRPSRRIIEP